jgi:hypothetical protein
MYIGTILMSIGSGLLTTLKVDSPSSHWIGYQMMAGLGIGFGMQQSNLAVQTCLPNRDVPIGISIIFFFQMFGGALFLSVAQNTFVSKFLQALGSVPGVRPDLIINTGATALRGHVPAAALPAVLEAYNHSLVKGPFLISTIVGSLSIIGALGTEWRSVKEKQNQQANKAAAKNLEAGEVVTEKHSTDDIAPKEDIESARNSTIEEKSELNPATQNTEPINALHDAEKKEIS